MPKWNYDGEYPNNPPQSTQGSASGAQPQWEQCPCSCHETRGYHECGWSCLKCGGMGVLPRSGAQQAPQATTVETTLDDLFADLADRRDFDHQWDETDAEVRREWRDTWRAHLQELVAAVHEGDRRDYLELQRVADHNISLEKAENAKLREALEQIQGSARYTFPDTPIGDVCVALQEQVREMKAQARAALSPESEGG